LVIYTSFYPSSQPTRRTILYSFFPHRLFTTTCSAYRLLGCESKPGSIGGYKPRVLACTQGKKQEM
jgi:hypothetical protein